ncbi:MAG: hypothetical protein JW910_16300 [Anaerolineae bacterium]|nr:hypothetical protein [Anaerolineae bacterium]
MPSQDELLKARKAAADPDAKRSAAIELLAATRSRQMIDAALYALERVTLEEADRPLLREKALYYFAHDDKDSGALLREKLLRLLSDLGHPDDADLYTRGVTVYERKPVNDTAQTCRAAALVGLATADRTAACRHAVRLLGEPDTSPLSGEPSLTALGVLIRFGETLPVYGFLLRQGRDCVARGYHEVVGKALASLGADFDPDLYAALAEPLLALDAPVVSMGVVDHVVEGRVDALYPLLERLITRTKDADLHRYAVLALAAARHDPLTGLLYQLARRRPLRYLRDYLEAVELSAHPERDALLAQLRDRLA